MTENIPRHDQRIEQGHIGLSKIQRSWAVLALDDEVLVEMIEQKDANAIADCITFQIDFVKKSAAETGFVVESDKLLEHFHSTFNSHIFTIGQVCYVVLYDINSCRNLLLTTWKPI